MEFHLPAYLSFGFIGNEAVALDLRADRYIRLGAAQAQALRALGASDTAAPAPAIFAGLAERGLLLAGRGALPTPVEAPIVHASAREAESETDGWDQRTFAHRIGIAEVAVARLSAGLWLRATGLGATVARWRTLRAEQPLQAEAGTDATIATLARSFAEARRFFPAQRRCVPDSLALARRLWRRGHDADLYFGVRLAPFAAHCWVQCGTLLLSDPLDSIAEFTPVFRL